MAILSPQYDNQISGASDTWDNDLGGAILSSEYFTAPSAPASTQTLTIDGDGYARTGWDAEGYNYTKLQSDDDGASAIYSPTLNNVAWFTLTDTTGLSGATITGLTVSFKAASLAAYDGEIEIGVRTGGTDYFSASKVHSSATYVLLSETWAVNPNTGVAWTTSDLDSVQIAVRKSDADGTRVSYGYAEVSYTTSGGSDTPVTPGVASLALSGLAPTIFSSDNKTATPSIASLTLTGIAPSVFASDNKSATPGNASLSLNTFAPTVFASSGTTVTPSQASLTLTTYTPVATLSDNTFVTPSLGSLVTSTLTPGVVVSDNKFAVPSLGSLSTTTYAPSITVSDNKLATPSLTSLTLSTFSPTVILGSNYTLVPSTASISISGFAPTISTSDNKTATPSESSLVLNGLAPTVSISDNKQVVPGSASISLTTFAPTLNVGLNYVITPSPGSLKIKGSAPIINGIVPSRDYYIDTSGNVYWVISESIGLVEKL